MTVSGVRAAVGIGAIAAALLFALASSDPALRPLRRSSEVSEEERAAVLGAVRDFNRIWQDFYASGGDPKMIDLIPASTEVKHRIFRDLGYLREAGLVLVQDLARMVPRAVSRVDAGDVEALLFEVWNFQYQDAVARRPAAELKGMGGGFRYHLRWSSGRWVVVGWEHESMPPPSPEERPW